MPMRMWGGPPGPRGSPRTRSSPVEPTRASAADRGGRPTCAGCLSCSMDVEEERMASAFAVVGDGHRFDGSPAADWEIVRDDPSAFLQHRVEDGAHFEVRLR